MAMAMACAVPALADDQLPNLDRRGAEVSKDVLALKAAPAEALLTGPSSASPEAIALGYIRAHAGSFGLDGADVDTLQLVARNVSPDGITHLRYDQVLDGVASYDSGLNAHVTRDGRLIEVTGHAVPDAELDTAKAAVGATASLGAARQATHGSGLAPGLTASSGDRATFTTGESARLMWTDTAADGPRLAWSVNADGADDTMYNVLVDAGSGDVLTRTSITDELGQARYYRKDPGSGPQVAVTMDPAWYDDNNGGTRLWGAYAHTYGDQNEANPTAAQEPTADIQQIPASGQSDGGYDWLYTTSNSFPGAGPCPASGCTWNSDPTRTATESVNLNEAATNAHVLVNQYHDYLAAPPIGFDAASGNFQRDNPAGVGVGHDWVQVEVDDGGNTTGNPDLRDNANFATPPDGTPGRMQMYLWDTYDVNGADVADVVWHEYGHGLSNRLIVTPSGQSELLSGQADMMGEAWSDFYALDHLAGLGQITDTPAPGEVTLGSYMLGTGGIRAKPIDCPVDPSGATPACNGYAGQAVLGGYTYADISGTNNSSPHNGSEVFAETLWDLRAAVGRTAALTLVTGGMRLSPANPSMLDERDAILREAVAIRSAPGAADDYYDDVWRVFAARGMGYGASTNSAAGDDLAPHEAYNLPAGLKVPGSATISDPYPGGDADGIIEPGETVRIAQPLTGAALTDESGITGTLTSVSGGGTIVDGSATWPTLGQARSGANTTALSVRLPSTCGAGVKTSLTATAPGADGGTVTTPVWIETGAGSSTRVPIPDLRTVTSGIGVSAAGNVTGLRVRIDELLHTWVGDLSIRLVHDGVTVTLFDPSNNNWSAHDLRGVTFDDAAASGVSETGSGPVTGTVRPVGSLAAFNGHPLAGAWTLSITDGAAPDSGTLEAWGLNAPGLTCTPAEVPVATTTSAGALGEGTAQLAGSVNPAGRATGLRFVWGTDTSYGHATATQDVGAGTAPVDKTATLTMADDGLVAGTTYHARVEAIREGGVVAEVGEDRTFTVPGGLAPPPDTRTPGTTTTTTTTTTSRAFITSPPPVVVPQFSARPKVAVARRASHRRRATTVRFALTAPAKVTVRIVRGRRSYGKAIRSTVKGTRSVVIRLGSLPKGRYKVTLTPAGGRAVTVSFTVR
jgi:subtilisin-like proprotein convertase family protein